MKFTDEFWIIDFWSVPKKCFTGQNRWQNDDVIHIFWLTVYDYRYNVFKSVQHIWYALVHLLQYFSVFFIISSAILSKWFAPYSHKRTIHHSYISRDIDETSNTKKYDNFSTKKMYFVCLHKTFICVCVNMAFQRIGHIDTIYDLMILMPL